METVNPAFETELQQLRQRLEEAEDVRRAITATTLRVEADN